MAEASSSEPVSRQPHLSKQDLATLNAAELTPLSPMVISRQATINIGAHTCMPRRGVVVAAQAAAVPESGKTALP